MFEINTKAETPPVERETLLTIDGEQLTIPKRFLPTDMLQYLHVLQIEGGDVAAKWAMHTALGNEGFWKLVNAGAAVDEHMLKELINCVTGRLLGMDVPIPGPKGEADPAPDPETDSVSEPADKDVWPEEDYPAPGPGSLEP